MSQEAQSYNSIAPLRNVWALAELINRVESRAVGLPGMATFYGPSGYGKTTAATYAANKFRAYSVQIKSAWTARKLCMSILLDLGIQPARTVADMIDQISAELASTGRPLIIDEADFLVQRKMIEIVRDIYESSGACVILIGEELLPQKLQKWERVHGRMLDWIPAQPADLKDVAHLAQIYCPGVELSEDLKQRILIESRASIRRICIHLGKVLEQSRLRGVQSFETAQIPQGLFTTGEAPKPRRF